MVSPRTLLLANGRIWQGGHAPVSGRPAALAIQEGRVAAVGAAADLRASFPGAAEADLGGRTVIPGLIDGHNHSVRAGVSWTRELDLARCRSRKEFLALVTSAVAAAKPGEWIAAVGGWHPSVFGGWAPERSLLDELAPDNPVFLQAMYEFAVVNSAAAQAVPEVSVPGDGRVAGMPAYSAFLAAMGTPPPERQRAGLAAMYRDFAAAGITGVHDPGGFSMTPEKYAPLYELWRSGELRCRLRLWFSAISAGDEAAQMRSWLDSGFDGPWDDVVRAVGAGEVVHFGCHDFEGLAGGFEISDDALAGFEEISRCVAAAGLPMQVHAVFDSSATRILDAWERVHADMPIDGLRFSLAHCDRLSPVNVARMKRLGIGARVDDRQAYRAGASLAAWGAGSMDTVPPLGHLTAAGVRFGAGTDATRASSYDPWRSLHWLITGTACGGAAQRADAHLLSREAALHAYTHANTWFSREEDTCGLLAPGYLADLAVLDRDYFTVPLDEILEIKSELTLVGGEAAYSSGAILDPA